MILARCMPPLLLVLLAACLAGGATVFSQPWGRVFGIHLARIELATFSV